LMSIKVERGRVVVAHSRDNNSSSLPLAPQGDGYLEMPTQPSATATRHHRLRSVDRPVLLGYRCS
jgi:hypothetical protein